MINSITVSFFFLAAGLFTSVTILSGYQVFFGIPMVFYTYLALKEKNFKLPVSAWWLIGFIAISIISLIMNFEILPNPQKNFFKIKYFLFGSLGIFVYRAWIPTINFKIAKWLTGTACLGMIIAGLYCIKTYFESVTGRGVPLTETMRYGYGTSMILLMLLTALLHRHNFKDWFDPRIGLVAFIIGFTGMYLTYTRGAFLGFLAGLPLVLFFYKKKIGIIAGGFVVIGIMTLAGFYLFGSGKYESRILMNKDTYSDVIRRSQWQAALHATKEKPLLGWGLSNFSTQLKRIKKKYKLEAKQYNNGHAHNLFLEVSSGTGLIGLFFFCGWLSMWMWESFRDRGYLRAFIMPFGIAFVISSQFEVTLDANNASMIFFFYAFFTALGMNSRPQSPG